jgi:hypothetical protein
MHDIIADINMKYDLGSTDQHTLVEVQDFYRLLAACDASYGDEIEV